jgi:hypothetical protein
MRMVPSGMARGHVLADVDVEPECLIGPRRHGDGEAAASLSRILGDELHGDVAAHVGRRARLTRDHEPLGLRRPVDVHVMLGEDLYRPPDPIGRIRLGGAVGDARLAAALREAGQRHAQRADPSLSGLHDDLQPERLVFAAEHPGLRPVPGRVSPFCRVIELATADFFAVVHGPHGRDLALPGRRLGEREGRPASAGDERECEGNEAPSLRPDLPDHHVLLRGASVDPATSIRGDEEREIVEFRRAFVEVDVRIAEKKVVGVC